MRSSGVLFRSARLEIVIAACLASLLEKNLCAPIADLLGTTDASETAGGECSARLRYQRWRRWIFTTGVKDLANMFIVMRPIVVRTRNGEAFISWVHFMGSLCHILDRRTASASVQTI